MTGQEPSVELEGSSEKKRRTDRVLAAVPIRIIANDANGVAFTEDAVTVTFNQQGARLSLTRSLLLDDVILILNRETGIEEEFRVVGAFDQVFGGRREWGVEALNPDGKIWGIEFTQPAEDLHPKALIDCGGCRRVVQSPLSSIEYDLILAVGMISRHCSRCNETTRWRPGVSPAMAELVEDAYKPLQPGREPRQAKRIKLVMRLRVRTVWGVTEVAQTCDVSKLGLSFLSTRIYNVGDEIFVVLPFAFNSVPVETKGKILWSNHTAGGRHYGVEYIKVGN